MSRPGVLSSINRAGCDRLAGWLIGGPSISQRDSHRIQRLKLCGVSICSGMGWMPRCVVIIASCCHATVCWWHLVDCTLCTIFETPKRLQEMRCLIDLYAREKHSSPTTQRQLFRKILKCYDDKEIKSIMSVQKNRELEG